MPANERSHDDRPETTVRRRRLRLLAHLGLFSVLGLVYATLGTSTTAAAPTVQDNRYLEGGVITVDYTCGGGDQVTIDILTAFGLNGFPMPVTISSAAVEPSPSPGEDFDVPFTWNVVLDPNVVSFAVGLGTTSFTISEGASSISATAGATGSLVGDGGTVVIDLIDTVADAYSDGPHIGTFNRTALVDEPIEFTPGDITTKVVTSGGVALRIACTPGAGVLTLNDADGVAPSTTTTTLPSVTPPTTAAATTTSVQAVALPRTGTNSNLLLVLLAIGLIDVGYLALSASRSPIRRRTSSVS